MNYFLSVLLAGALSGVCAEAMADGSATPFSLEALKPPAGMKVSVSPHLSSNYRDTQCVDVSKDSTRQKLGFICRTSDPEFLKDMGIDQYDSLKEDTRPARRPSNGLVISTPMRQYDMQPFLSGRVHAAAVDCDIANEPIYRATGTCHVGVAQSQDGVTTYGNFVLKDHRIKKNVTSESAIRSVWQSLISR